MRNRNNTANSKKGIAMIMVLCVMALIVVLSLTMMLCASILLTSTQTSVAKEQSRIMSVSLSKVLEQELVGKSFDSQSAEDAANDGSLWFYIKESINNGRWPYYNEDERGHTSKYAFRTFKLDMAELPEELKDTIDSLEDTEVLMYWESSNDSAIDSTPLKVIVTCRYQGQLCTITSEYTLESSIEIDEISGENYTRWVWSLNWRE